MTFYWIGDIVDSYRDWQYSRVYRQYRAITKEIELRVYARENTKVNDENRAEVFLAFLDRRIDNLIRRRNKVGAKLDTIYASWKA